MDIYTPHPYQQHCIDKIIEQKEIGLFLDMGLGKTSITLTALEELMFNRFLIKKVLIIAPKKVAEATWTEEAKKWQHLQIFRFSLILGTEKERLRALYSKADIYITNRENVVWLVNQYLGKREWDFDTVVIDELSSFKSASAKRFKALKRVRAKIERVIGLTGTPAPNGYIDLWAQVYLLDKGLRLYDSVTKFRTRFFNHNPYKHEYKAKEGAKERIDTVLKDLCISMSAEDYLNLPDMVVNDVPVHLSDKAKKQYLELERTYFLEILEHTQEGEINAQNAAVLTGKLLQLCGGAVYDDQQEAIILNTSKLESLSELLESLLVSEGGIIIFYQFKHELERIRALINDSFPKARCRELKTKDDIEAWNAKEVDILLAHPASTAYGLNLQQGGNHIIWYTPPWSLELYSQANKRLHRQGQKSTVFVHRLLTPYQDKDVALALASKDEAQKLLLDSLKAKLKFYKESVGK